MANDIRHFTATIPAGTPKSAPAAVSIAFPPRVVRQVDWRVPNGPMGVLGFLLAMGGVPVLPGQGFTFVVANGESGSWPVDDQPDSGAWQVLGYNTGANPHSVYLAFHLDLIEPPPRRAQLLDAVSLYEVPDLSHAGPPVSGRM